jgi:hypothetical protein
MRNSNGNDLKVISESEARIKNKLSNLNYLGDRKKYKADTHGILLGILSREDSLEYRISLDDCHGNWYLRIQGFRYDIRNNTWNYVKSSVFSIRIHELIQFRTFIDVALNTLSKNISKQEENDEPNFIIKNKGFN